ARPRPDARTRVAAHGPARRGDVRAIGRRSGRARPLCFAAGVGDPRLPDHAAECSRRDPRRGWRATMTESAESARLAETRSGTAWRRWRPYLSERQWGTVREDYSDGGDAWNYFTHDQARSRAYRWG